MAFGETLLARDGEALVDFGVVGLDLTGDGDALPLVGVAAGDLAGDLEGVLALVLAGDGVACTISTCLGETLPLPKEAFLVPGDAGFGEDFLVGLLDFLPLFGVDLGEADLGDLGEDPLAGLLDF